jgi:predicted GTPase
VIAVLTHVDLLSPALEWAPPYDWSQPRRPKEKNMADALEVVHEQLGPFLTAAVPVCTAEGRVYGVEEWFLPALLEQLGEAKGVALLRCLRAEADADKTRRVFLQLLNVGEQLVKVWLQRPVKR